MRSHLAKGAGLRGAGLGFRRELMAELKAGVPAVVDFFEISPENWIHFGGGPARDLRAFTERYPFVCHGLLLSLGGPGPLNESLLRHIKAFMRTHGIGLYTEHLAYCSDQGYLYDLLPLPFTAEAVRHVAARIARTQEILGQRIAVENTSYYTTMPPSEMSELEFILAVLAAADCDLHLDVNNVYVNSINHRFDARAFIDALPTDRIVYMHIAGHDRVADDLLVDTHGAAIIDPVWALLAHTYARHGVAPTLLERDLRIPPLADLARELAMIAAQQRKHDHGPDRTRRHA
ncbi:MAG: HvfB family MNIO-type RiPP peptide maturase [Acidiferrobacter sp.]